MNDENAIACLIDITGSECVSATEESGPCICCMDRWVRVDQITSKIRNGEHIESQADIISRLKSRNDELHAQLATARADALEEAASALHPMLRAMISRSEAARIIRALKEQQS